MTFCIYNKVIQGDLIVPSPHCRASPPPSSCLPSSHTRDIQQDRGRAGGQWAGEPHCWSGGWEWGLEEAWTSQSSPAGASRVLYTAEGLFEQACRFFRVNWLPPLPILSAYTLQNLPSETLILCGKWKIVLNIYFLRKLSALFFCFLTPPPFVFILRAEIFKDFSTLTPKSLFLFMLSRI